MTKNATLTAVQKTSVKELFENIQKSGAKREHTLADGSGGIKYEDALKEAGLAEIYPINGCCKNTLKLFFKKQKIHAHDYHFVKPDYLIVRIDYETEDDV